MHIFKEFLIIPTKKSVELHLSSFPAEKVSLTISAKRRFFVVETFRLTETRWPRVGDGRERCIISEESRRAAPRENH